jgi:hypothetical protein
VVSLCWSRKTVPAYLLPADRKRSLLCACLPSAVPATRPRLPRGLSTTDHAKSRPRWVVRRSAGARLLGLDWHGTISDPVREAASAR